MTLAAKNRTPNTQLKGKSERLDATELGALWLQSSAAEHRKEFGQVFTPRPIAKIMAEWISSGSPGRVCDPAVGTGVLLQEVRDQLPNATLIGYDLDPAVIEFSKTAYEAAGIAVRNEDFLLAKPEIFDAIIANPPYLKSHDFAIGQYDSKGLGKSHGVQLSALSNIYILFILTALSRLRGGGRAAFIIPNEWCNANFGMPLKEVFARTGTLKRLVYFCSKLDVFGSALTTASVLLMEKSNTDSELEVAYVESADDFLAIADDEARWTKFDLETLSKVKKWDHAFKNGGVSPVENLPLIGSYCRTRRGIATGANHFFLIGRNMKVAFGIQDKHVRPCIGRASDAPGLIFTTDDVRQLETEDKRCLLVDMSGPLSEGEQSYIEKGRQEGVDSVYLCRTRKTWYRPEPGRPSPIWAAVFNRDHVKFIWNKADALNLTAYHCLTPDFTDPQLIGALVALLNSQPAQHLILAHRRVYGGGLNKFEPRDLLDISLPNPKTFTPEAIEQLNSHLATLDREFRDQKRPSVPELNKLAQDLIDSARVSHSASEQLRLR